jgi:hypothetical protein
LLVGFEPGFYGFAPVEDTLSDLGTGWTDAAGIPALNRLNRDPEEVG